MELLMDQAYAECCWSNRARTLNQAAKAESWKIKSPLLSDTIILIFSLLVILREESRQRGMLSKNFPGWAKACWEIGFYKLVPVRGAIFYWSKAQETPSWGLIWYPAAEN